MPNPMQTAKDVAKETAERQKGAAADKLDEMSGRLSERIAGGLEQMSSKLRSQDVDGLLREAESFARSQPLAFFGASLAAGFLAMRYLKSSRQIQS